MPNVISRGQTADTTRLDSEKSHGFEIGTKAQIFDNSLRAQLTAYSYKFKNLQTVSFDGTTVSYQFNNAAAATTKGVELQLDWQATPELRFASALTYNKARFKSFPTAQCYGLQAATPGSGCVKSAAFPSGVQDLSGARLPHASDWMGSLSFNYDKPVGDYHVVLYGDVNYQSKMNSSEINDPAGEVPGFAKVNAGIKFGPSEGPWEIAVFGRNLTNRLYFTTVNDKAGGLPGEVSANSSSRPREIWVETSVKF
jgi:iron complex outermembrane receptor protein